MKVLLNKKIVKPVLEYVLEITFSHLQVHTTRFVVFTIQRQSDPQVLMLTGQSHTNADLINWPDANFNWHLKSNLLADEFIIS